MAPSPLSIRPRRLAQVALFVAVLFILSGCMRINIALDLHQDDTASMQLDLAFQDQALVALGYDPDEFWADAETEIGGDLPPGAIHERYPEAGWSGSRITVNNAPITDLSSFEGAGVGDISITRDGDYFVFSAMTGLADEMQGMADEIPAGTAPLSLTLTVTCPGQIDYSNGAIGENTVTWDLTQFTSAEALTARCSAVSTGGGRIANEAGTMHDGETAWFARWWPVLLGSVLTLGLLGGLGYFLRRSSHRERDNYASNFEDAENWGRPDDEFPTQTYVAPHEIAPED